MDQPMPPASSPLEVFFYSDPESLFRVGAVVGNKDGARASMLLGPWSTDRAGRFSRGSLGVLLDVILGVAVVARRREDQWPVSVELSVDFCGDPASSGFAGAGAGFAGSGEISGEGRVVALGANDGLALGSIIDSDGRLLATATQRLRFTDRLPFALGDPSALVDDHTLRNDIPVGTVDQLLGAAVVDGDSEMVLPPSKWLSNSSGAMHGGILTCAAEVLGNGFLQSEGAVFLTSSVHVAYLRPAPISSPITFTTVAKHLGRTLRVAEVTGRNEDGKACVVSTVTCLLAE